MVKTGALQLHCELAVAAKPKVDEPVIFPNSPVLPSTKLALIQDFSLPSSCGRIVSLYSFRQILTHCVTIWPSAYMNPWRISLVSVGFFFDNTGS
jgi:hypothetical protein